MGYGFLTVFHSFECKISPGKSWQGEKVSSWTYFEEWATPKKWAEKWADVSPQPTHLSASLQDFGSDALNPAGTHRAVYVLGKEAQATRHRAVWLVRPRLDILRMVPDRHGATRAVAAQSVLEHVRVTLSSGAGPACVWSAMKTCQFLIMQTLFNTQLRNSTLDRVKMCLIPSSLLF